MTNKEWKEIYDLLIYVKIKSHYTRIKEISEAHKVFNSNGTSEWEQISWRKYALAKRKLKVHKKCFPTAIKFMQKEKTRIEKNIQL